MSKQCIYQDKRKDGIFIQFVIRQEQLHHTTFRNKNLDHPVLLKGCGRFFTKFMYQICLIQFIIGQMLKGAVYIKAIKRRQMIEVKKKKITRLINRVPWMMIFFSGPE